MTQGGTYPAGYHTELKHYSLGCRSIGRLVRRLALVSNGENPRVAELEERETGPGPIAVGSPRPKDWIRGPLLWRL